MGISLHSGEVLNPLEYYINGKGKLNLYLLRGLIIDDLRKKITAKTAVKNLQRCNF